LLAEGAGAHQEQERDSQASENTRIPANGARAPESKTIHASPTSKVALGE
jgi:hypothetical protein